MVYTVFINVVKALQHEYTYTREVCSMSYYLQDYCILKTDPSTKIKLA